jgi:hypothetical protein
MAESKEIRTAEDADSIREVIEGVFDGWYADSERIDWTEFLERVEGRSFTYDLGDQADSPAIRRIKAIVKELRKQRQ